MKAAYGAAITEFEKSGLIVARLPFAPVNPELSGNNRKEMNNVVIPTDTAELDDTLYIYYGAAIERKLWLLSIFQKLVNKWVSQW